MKHITLGLIKKGGALIAQRLDRAICNDNGLISGVFSATTP